MISQKVRSGSGQPGLGEGDTRQSSGASPGVQAEMPAEALLLQWFLFSVINGSFCWRGEKRWGAKRPIFFLKSILMEKFQPVLLNTPGLSLLSALHDYLFR